MAIELAEQLEGRHPAFVHRSAGCVDILCHASGESEVPGVAIAKNRDQVRAFIIGQWLGEEGEELDEVMALFDGHDWDDDPYLQWTFEIGRVKLEQVYEALVEEAAAVSMEQRSDYACAAGRQPRRRLAVAAMGT